MKSDVTHQTSQYVDSNGFPAHRQTVRRRVARLEASRVSRLLFEGNPFHLYGRSATDSQLIRLWAQDGEGYAWML